jgi:hypothetical protein
VNLDDVTADLGQALTYVPEVLDEDDPEIVVTPARGIEGLRIFPYWPDRISPPTAIVQWPETIDFDSTMVRGGDSGAFLVTILVAKTDARAAQKAIAPYCSGSGSKSVKEAIESYEPTAYDSARVKSLEFAIFTIASTDYLAASFDIHIIGSGA